MSSTRARQRVNAPRARVYRALLDPRAIARWKVPTGMTSRVHAFDAREGGSFGVSLTYDEPTGTGKTTAHTDTYHGRFAKLVKDEQVVEVLEEFAMYRRGEAAEVEDGVHEALGRAPRSYAAFARDHASLFARDSS